MPEGVSRRELAKILGVSEGAVRKAIEAKRISVLPGGRLDPVAAREAWGASTDPVRTKVRTEPKVRTGGTQRAAEVSTEAEARQAISLVARILAEEGAEAAGPVDFAKARTAELILKARQRSLDQAEQEGSLVNRAAAEAAFFAEARAIRDAWIAWPARIAVELADELGIEPRHLTTALDREVRRHLAELGEPTADFANAA
jgi:hypothetical protein